jgi:hypothetical protein
MVANSGLEGSHCQEERDRIQAEDSGCTEVQDLDGLGKMGGAGEMWGGGPKLMASCGILRALSPLQHLSFQDWG